MLEISILHWISGGIVVVSSFEIILVSKIYFMLKIYYNFTTAAELH